MSNDGGKHDREQGAKGTKAQQKRRIAEAFEIKPGGGKHRTGVSVGAILKRIVKGN